ncbi:MAG: hypothetical protein V1944_00795 [Candidatus Aenigmatarchaeota archaeon]
MSFRKDAEELKKTPEFIKVAYDASGRPIGVKPANGNDIPEKVETPSTRIVAQTVHYDTKLIGQWLGVINQNMHVLREQINILENPNEKILSIVEEAIAKNMIFVSTQIDLVNKELQNYKILSNSVMEQLNLVNENFSLLRKEISDNQHVSRAIIAEIEFVKNEVRNPKVPEEIINMLNSMNENFEILRSRVMEISRETIQMNSQLSKKLVEVATKEDLSNIDAKFNDVATKDDVSNVYLKFNDVATKENISSIDAKFNYVATKNDLLNIYEQFSDLPTREDLDMVISGFISKQELRDVKTELEELINKNAINKDELISDLIKKMKLLKKTKKRKAKKLVKRKIKKIRKKKTKTILKSTIRKFLAKKFGLNEDERVLVVTDHKMEKIGNKVYETCRKISENTVFLVMEKSDRPGQEPEDSVAEAMKNTDRIIGITFYTLKKTDALRNAVEVGVKACVLSKNLKFTLVK